MDTNMATNMAVSPPAGGLSAKFTALKQFTFYLQTVEVKYISEKRNKKSDDDRGLGNDLTEGIERS